jgi:hypothetical protein
MSIRNKLMKIAGKDNFELDPHIKTSYILRLCIKYGLMLIRGGPGHWLPQYRQQRVYRFTR